MALLRSWVQTRSKSGLSLCLDSGSYKKSVAEVETTPRTEELEVSSPQPEASNTLSSERGKPGL